ncbi:alpha/beta hydrolase [Fictibacillus sp. Mic-4]|uniref:alpha/beta fold hydrolase n=1 Tax=Fictibacillus sp. Mic-4 TaxID=3132826 RepID=UPI003CEF3011
MSKKQLVMLPGWGMESAVWSLLADGLRESFSIQLVDWRGLKTIDGVRKRVNEYIQQDTMESFTVIGWSLGSLAAIDIASTYPSKVRHLILLSGTSRFTMDSDYECGVHPKMVERMKRQLMRNKEKTLASFYELMFSTEERRKGEVQRFMGEIGEKFVGDDVHSLRSGLDYLIASDFRSKLEQISSPVLLIHGEEDAICPFRASQYIEQRIKEKVTIKRLQHTGHIPFFTMPDQCLQWIKEFVGGEANHDQQTVIAKTIQQTGGNV